MADANLIVRIDGQDNLSGELKKLESGVIRFVGAVSAALTSLSAIGFPVVSAAKFEKELLNAAKTTDYARDELVKLRKGLDDLSKQSNITAVDLAKIATLGGQLGIGADKNVAALIEFTKQIGVAITALDIPAEEAVDSIGKLINIFNVPASEYKNLISSLNEVSNASTASATQLFDVVRRIGNLGGSVSLPQAAALSASMIDLGLTAETAGTTITKIFADMKSNASAFANVAIRDFDKVSSGTEIMRYTTEEWVSLVEKDGLTALKSYVAGLNSLSTAQAAQIKAQLTGEGRLFEAVTKLQQQQLRQGIIQRELLAAEESLAAAREKGSGATAAQVKAEESRVEALKAATTQANVLDRLNEKAQRAYKTGDSALKEQATTLAGLAAQWQRFGNNLTSIFNAIGGQFLQPLTAGLRELSNSLENSNVGEQLKQAADNLVEVARRIGDVFAFIRAQFAGTVTLDWGALLNVAGLLLAATAIKGLGAVLKMMGASALTTIPGLTLLQNKLFGVSAAMQKAAADAALLNAQNMRQGGWIQQGSAALSRMIDQYLTLTKSLTDTRDKAARVAARAQAGLSQSQSALATSLAQLPARYNTVALAQQRLAYFEQQRQAALAAGNRRAAGGYQSQITQLNRTLAAVQRNEQAVRSYANQIALAQRTGANAQNRINSITAPFSVQAGNVVAAARKAATDFRTAFSTAVAAGGSPLTAFFTALSSSASTAAAAGARAGAAYAASFKAGIASLAAASGGAILSALGLSNFSERWAKSTTKTAKFVTVLSGTFSVLGRVAAGAFAILSRFVGIFFFALMIKEMLKLLGLWDDFLGLIRKGIEWYNRAAVKFNLPTIEMPDFLKPAEDLALANKEAEQLVNTLKRASDEAAKFGKQQQSNVLLLRTGSEAAIKDLTFDQNDPTNATQKAKEYFASLLSGYSQVEVSAQSLVQVEKDLKAARAKALADARAADAARAQNYEAVAALKDAEAKLVLLQAQRFYTRGELDDANRAVTEARANLNLLFGGVDRAAAGSAARVTELQDAFDALSKQISLSGGKDDNPFFGQAEAAKNLATSFFSADEAARLFTRTNGAAVAPMRAYIAAMEEQRNTAEAVTAAEKKLDELRTSSPGSAEFVAASAALEGTRLKADAADEAFKATRESVIKLGRSKTFLEDFLSNFENTTNIEASKRAIDDITAAIRNLPKDAFKGSVLPEVKVDSFITAASTVAVKTRIKDLYDSWASAARTAADRAKNAATAALSEVERLARSAQSTIEKIDSALASNTYKAAKQITDRAADAASRQRLSNIQRQYDYERALLDQLFSAQKSYFDEQEAGGVQVFYQKQLAYEAEQQALFELEERYSNLRDIEQDRVNIQKSKQGIKDEIKQFDDLIKKVDYYKTRVEEANRVLTNPAAPLDKRAGAIEQRNVALDKMRALYTQLESAGERIASTEPIGGQILVEPAQIEKVKQALLEVSSTVGKVGLEGADQIAPVFDQLATKFSNVSKNLGTEIDIAATAFDRFSGKSGKALDDLRARYAGLIAQNSEFAGGIERIQDLTQKGLLNLGTVQPEEINALTQSLQNALNSVDVTSKLNLDVDEQALAARIANALKNASERSSGGTPAAIAVTATGESVAAIERQLETNVQPKLKAEIFVDKVRWSAGQFSLPISNNARGGFFADIVKSMPKFARGGGRINGPGNGTSDSILARLSNGEYVMDALTTSRFGPNFFESLQKAARGGYSLNFMRGLQIPQFATGGFVGAEMATAFSGIANDFKSSISDSNATRDVMDININSNGQRATIQAERAQAQSLVGILRQFEKGR